MQSNFIIYTIVTTLLILIGIYRCHREEMSFWMESAYPFIIITWTGIWFWELIITEAMK